MCENVSNSVFLTICYLVSVILLWCMRLNVLPGSARGCPGSTCISPVWLGRCCSLSLSHSLCTAICFSGLVGWCCPSLGPRVGLYPSADILQPFPKWGRYPLGCGVPRGIGAAIFFEGQFGSLAFLETHLISQAS